MECLPDRFDSVYTRTALTRHLRCVVFVCCVLVTVQGVGLTQAKAARRVLILNEAGTTYPAINLIDQGIRESLQSSGHKVDLYREYFDTFLFPDPEDQQRIRDVIVRKYHNRKPDVIVTVGSAPLQFLAGTHDESFKDIPIVFCLPNGSEDDVATDPHITGVTSGVSADRTVDAALRLLPATERVVVVGGAGAFDHMMTATVKQQLSRYEGRIDISYLTDLPMAALLERVKSLPSHTIVLLIEIGKDATGNQFTSREVGPMIAAASNAPVFSLFDVFLNHGEVGGNLASFIGQARLAGNLVAQILDGAKPQNLPITRATNVYIYDWQALKRWELPSSKVPSGSVIINKPVSVWLVYKWYIGVGVVILALQTILTCALMLQKRKRRVAETQVLESEGRFRGIANNAPVLIWISSPDKLRNYVNQPWLDFTGGTFEQALGYGWSDRVHPEDMKECIETYVQAFDNREPFSMEYRMRRNDGEYRWLIDHGVARFDPDGLFAGYIGSCIYATEKKRAEVALGSVNRSLIEAQEQERTRVGRELHDDIVQRLALLQIGLDRTAQHLPRTHAEIKDKLQEFWDSVAEIAKDVQVISHGLHTAKLEYLGLVGAMRDFCAEFSEKYSVEVSFSETDLPGSIAYEVSLSLFRVVQAALMNAVKHGGAKVVEVLLHGSDEQIHLTIRDFGGGFDLNTAKNGHGIGLVSMRERVRLVNGNILIQSTPSLGTTIEVHLPSAGQALAQAASARSA
jgi:PAS domain S-box-containing protein